MDYDSKLRKLGFEGLEARGFSNNPIYTARLSHELEVIQQLGFSPYFLVMWDIAKFVRHSPELIAGPGRGSAAGSLLFYCLYVTDIDPIKYGLFFERFLNKDRVSPPDCDYDVNNRELVIEYLKERYGEDRVARVGTLGFLRTKSAIRDICRILGKDFKFTEKLTSLVPPPVAGLWASFEAECEVEPALLSPEYSDVTDPVSKLWGTVRSYGTHAGGVAIAPGPINRFVPLYVDKSGNPVSQFDWRDLEEAGLLKFDILGLKILEVIRLCLQYIKSKGQTVDLNEIKDGDELAYRVIQSGDLDGIFQLGGSEAIKQLTLSLAPSSIEDISMVSALFRPGPLSAKMDKDVIQIRQGKRAPSYLHPKLEPILKNTYGVPIFQESVMRICTDLCGYTASMADTMRKIMGKKSREAMKKERPRFIDGAISQGVSKDIAEKLFEQLQGNAEYIFNASHSISYGTITYWCAYLKGHYPVEFYAALLANEDKPDRKIRYAQAIANAEIKLLPPNINRSGFHHQPENGSIRFGLSHIKNMPKSIAEQIAKAQRPFTSIYEVIEEVPVNATAVQSLGYAGAYQDISAGLNKKELAEYSKSLLDYHRSLESHKHKIQKIQQRKTDALDKFSNEMALWNQKMRAKESKYQERLAAYQTRMEEVKNKNLIRQSKGQKLIKEPVPPKEVKPLKKPVPPVINEPPLPSEPNLPSIQISEKEAIQTEREYLGMYLTKHPLDVMKEDPRIQSILSLKSKEKGEYCFIRGVLQSIKVINTRNKKLMANLYLEDKTGGVDVTIFPGQYERLKGNLEEGEIYEVEGKVDIRKMLSPDKEEEFSLTQVRSMKVRPVANQVQASWQIEYPLLKGTLLILPGLSAKTKEDINLLLEMLKTGDQ